VHLDAAAVGRWAALDQAERLAARDQRHHAVRLGLQALGQFADGGPLAARA
jgi:hypothetical protein